MFTCKALERINVPYHCVIEAQEFDLYAKKIDPKKLIVLPFSNKGLCATRNWIWDYAKQNGHEYFWTMDDNIRYICRLNNNLKIRVNDGTVFKAMEDFTMRYENVAISGMQYEFFIPRKKKHRVVSFNSRIYSNMFIKTNIPYRNELFYNDDTDLCLRVMMDGWCTILFNSFLIKKETTMTVKGGNTPVYVGDGRLKMAKQLQDRFPEITKIKRRWDRWQHVVDYSQFKKNKLIKKQGLIIPSEPNEYGMKLLEENELSKK